MPRLQVTGDQRFNVVPRSSQPVEPDVALAVGRGPSDAEISAVLLVSLDSVKAYVSWLLVRLRFDNPVQVALLVQNAGRP